MRTTTVLAAITLAVAISGVAHAECPGQTTREMEQCLTAEREEAVTSLERYEEEVLRLLSDQVKAREAFIASQTAWRHSARRSPSPQVFTWKSSPLAWIRSDRISAFISVLPRVRDWKRRR